MTETMMDGPRYGSPEWAAAHLAEKVLASEQEAERARRESRRNEISAEVTSAPGMPPGVAERRAWALRAASEGLTEVIASPDVSEPLADYVWRMPSGEVRVARSARPTTIVIHPGNAEQMERWFDQQRRDSEDRRLIAHYGAQQCVAAGFMTAADAERLAKPKQAPGPGTAPYSIERSVA